MVGWSHATLVILCGSLFGAGIAAAQDPAPHPCDTETGATQRVCRAGYDALTVMVPAAAIAATGGNRVLGTAAGGRGFGDVAVTFRAGLVRTVLPDAAYDGVGDTVPAVRRLPIVVPRVDLRFGLLRRVLPVGAASVDLLASVSGIPVSAADEIRFGSDVRTVGGVALGFGYGIRIGMEPAGALPTVSLNAGRQDLPRFTVGSLGQAGNVAYTVGVSAIDVRLLLGRRFGLFELTGGGGVDLIKGNYSLTYQDPATAQPAPRADSSLSTMRIVTTVNGALLLGPVRLAAEGGFQVGKAENVTTLFEALNTSSGRFFGAFGIGIKL